MFEFLFQSLFKSNGNLISVSNGRTPTDPTTAVATSSYSTFAYTIAGHFLQTSIWVDFQHNCAAFRLAASNATFHFFDSSWRELRSLQLLWHALFQNSFPKHDLRAIISDLVVNGLLRCCLAVFVGFSGDFDSFLESIAFQVSLLEIILHLFISETQFVIKNPNYIAFCAIH